MGDVHHDDRHVSTLEAGCLSLGEREGKDDYPVGSPPARQRVEVLVALLFGQNGTERELVVALGKTVHQSPEPFDKGWVGEVGDDRGDGHRAPERQSAGDLARTVVELVDDGEDLAAGLLAHERASVEHSRNRPDADARPSGDIGDGDGSGRLRAGSWKRFHHLPNATGRPTVVSIATNSGYKRVATRARRWRARPG